MTIDDAATITTVTVAQPMMIIIPFWMALTAGGIAGTAVDVSLYPLDTIKTRLQAPVGFWAAGGFRGIYNGLPIVTAGSAPSAALFFGTYEYMKHSSLLPDRVREEYPALNHMAASSVGEVAACLVRVPTEVIKSRLQTVESATLRDTIVELIRHGNLYRGFGITLFREIPFCCIQFPLYEYLKQCDWAGGSRRRHNNNNDNPAIAALCGSVAGAVAAAATTPLDVLKTRRMLGTDQHGVKYQSVLDVWRRTSNADLWKGIQPRVFWISLGGYIFFGAYETSRQVLQLAFG